MSITDEEQAQHDLDNKCHLCNQNILDSDAKVCTPDHLSGKFLGTAHNVVNTTFVHLCT